MIERFALFMNCPFVYVKGTYECNEFLNNVYNVLDPQSSPYYNKIVFLEFDDNNCMIAAKGKMFSLSRNEISSIINDELSSKELSELKFSPEPTPNTGLYYRSDASDGKLQLFNDGMLVDTIYSAQQLSIGESIMQTETVEMPKTSHQIDWNKHYQFSGYVSDMSFTISDITSTNSHCKSSIAFTTGEDYLSISMPNTISWYGGVGPTFNKNTIYCIYLTFEHFTKQIIGVWHSFNITTKEISIVGEISSTSNIISLKTTSINPGTYILRYVDSFGTPLSSFTDIATMESTSQYNGLILDNAAPHQSSYVGVFSSDGQHVGNIELGNLKHEYGDRIYSFGVLSDVHQQSSQSNENMEDFRRALTVLNERESVDFVVICGDITQNGTASELAQYKNIVDECSANIPVYVAAGNHDATRLGLNTSQWQTYTGNTRSFSITHESDHFIFLGMDKWAFGDTSGNPYDDADINWLEGILEQHKNERCFIVTHLFFPDRAGNFKSIYPSENWLQGTQLQRLEELHTKYVNTIWLSGHSHWKCILQEKEDKANVFRTDSNGSGWSVHIPSCASPTDSDGVSTRVYMPLESEGAIVDAYENCIGIRMMDLKNDKHISIGQYVLDTTIATINSHLLLIDNFVPRFNWHNNVDYPDPPVLDNDGYIVFTFTEKGQKFYITGLDMLTDDSKAPQVNVEDVIYSDNISESDKSGVGIYLSDTTYGFSGSAKVEKATTFDEVDGFFLQFNISTSKYTGNDFPITIKVKNLTITL